MNKSLAITISIVAFVGVILSVLLIFLIKPYWQGIKPAWFPSDKESEQILDSLEQTGLDQSDDLEDYGPFTIHPDFKMTIYSRDLVNPRVMIFDNAGRILVSEPSEKRISILEAGEKIEQKVLLDNLNRPHGLAIKDNQLFVAETGQIVAYDYDVKKAQAGNGRVILDLPAGGRHWTRTIGFGPDDHLYISIGSSCNICKESDWRRIKILRYNLDTQVLEVYASGLRNSVFFAWHPVTGELYATEMGRDWLGDDLPPDELNLIEAGQDYGYPYCYGDNVVDPEYDQSAKCRNAKGAFYNFFAHESPLGIDFFDNDAIIALHGSWNRSEPIGYEVIRLLEQDGYQSRETIMSGWLQADGSSIGRPAGILADSDNQIIYIADDKAGVIYQLKKR